MSYLILSHGNLNASSLTLVTMPVAIFSYLLACKYNRYPDDVASMIFITALLSFVTVPLLLTYLM